ncbi:hypothetical protein [Desulfallas thermosapovorans]|uniref:Uncharacterized protein n=1 Tax=Desulfallas thermosapovorans DSM 6562 TaxID=1121431 RepID=A0A5S4ZQK3_9FIRM|nr:hypothetical protein [Desulfallas thermosapovorans]TYO94881.1 hypothetical protein LX24_02135 [Desulfallas thermosapovorans DSM 6562]
MRKADFQARIKKIEIVNKVLADGWAQAIRVQLDDIELTNENLLELRQFRPNEQVNVNIEPVQLNLFDMQAHRSGEGDKPFKKREQALDGAEDDEEFLSFVEDDQTPAGKVVREFKV